MGRVIRLVRPRRTNPFLIQNAGPDPLGQRPSAQRPTSRCWQVPESRAAFSELIRSRERPLFRRSGTSSAKASTGAVVPPATEVIVGSWEPPMAGMAVRPSQRLLKFAPYESSSYLPSFYDRNGRSAAGGYSEFSQARLLIL